MNATQIAEITTALKYSYLFNTQLTSPSIVNSILDPNHPVHKALKMGFLTSLSPNYPNILIEVSHFLKDNKASLKGILDVQDVQTA
jgi:hypothetical protein